jgi:predicted Ser/Thr protein kinase
MTSPFPTTPPASLGGALVGRWRILERVGSGNNGITYRVCLAESSGEAVYALKMARESRDPRFEREAELLSRLAHPNVPGLVESGVWKAPWNREYPYLVMEWVEGVPLYDWAARRGLTSRQALRVLAQVARALEATHALGVHRDVKGDNVLVTPEGRAMLVDFGCCSYRGARPLTETCVPPGTRLYRSPRCLRFQHRFRDDFEARYDYQPEDDVYALGVTAYFLVTGTYPPPGTDPERREEEGRAIAPRMLPPSELATVAPELEALILRMLSEEPRARGTAGELAKELEQAAKQAKPRADERLVPSCRMLPTERAARPGPTRWHLARQALRRHRRPLAAAGAVAAGVLALVFMLPVLPVLDRETQGKQSVAVEEEEAMEEDAAADERAVGVADGGVDGVLAAAQARPSYGVPEDVLTTPVPEKPEPGQKKPPCKPSHRAINGGCWVLLAEKPPCDDSYEHDGKCYLPVIPRGAIQQPTSGEP